MLKNLFTSANQPKKKKKEQKCCRRADASKSAAQALVNSVQFHNKGQNFFGTVDVKCSIHCPLNEGTHLMQFSVTPFERSFIFY
jgi:hypothetical protein